jgi:hypothetical protein
MWHGQPDGRAASMAETIEQTALRQAAWPCSRLLDVLSPQVKHIGM